MQALLFLCLALPSPGAGRDLFGASVAAAHDANGDDKPDLWIGSPQFTKAPGQGIGGVWLVCAASGKALLEIPPPADARGFGWTLATLGDIDGDGIGELAVGNMFVATKEQPVPEDRMPNYTPLGEGCVYLYSGANGKLLRSWRGPADTLKFIWSSSGAGPSLASVGDWNADGKGDLAIGWCYASKDQPEQGCVRVVSGGDGELLHEFWGERAHDNFGFAVTGMLRSERSSSAFALAASAIPEYVGKKEGVDANLTQRRPGYVRGYSQSGEKLFDRTSPFECRQFGYSLSFVPASVEHEARLAVGQSFYCKHGPAVHFLDAENGTQLGAFGPPTLAAWESREPRAEPPCEIIGPAESFGARIVAVRDFDDDGLFDVVVTAPEGYAPIPAAVMSSASGQVLRSIALPDLTAHADSIPWPSHFGITATSTGDCNDDGIADFAIGGASVRCGSCIGVVALYSGKDASLLRWFTRSMLHPK